MSALKLTPQQRAQLERECQRFVKLLKTKPGHVARERAIAEHDTAVRKITGQSSESVPES